MFTKGKVLITGGLGFIFSHVTQFLAEKDYDVVVVDNNSEGAHPEIIDGSFRYVCMDVSERDIIDLIKHEQPDYIIHAAAISDVDSSIKDPERALKNNFISTLNVFEGARAVKGLKKLVNISTDEVYGECEHRKTEEEILFPKNPYSLSKAAGSLLRLAYDNTYEELKDKTTETRFCNVFGPRQDTRKVLSAIKNGLKTGDVVPIHNGGKGYREFIYVKNIPPAVELVMLKGTQTYNITTNDGFTVDQLIKRAEELTGKKLKTKHSNRPGMDLKYQMDNKRILKLGWKPHYSFDQGLKEYLND
jgi:dTDP-glucose 4,6-dehydratase